MKLTAVLTLPGPNFNYEVSEQKLTIHSEVNGHSQFAFSLVHRNLLFFHKKGFTTFLTTLVYWETVLLSEEICSAGTRPSRPRACRSLCRHRGCAGRSRAF